MSDERPVELRPAYVWTCEECGRDTWGLVTYGPYRLAGATRGKAQTLVTVTDLNLVLPNRVICLHCGAAHDVAGVDDD